VNVLLWQDNWRKSDWDWTLSGTFLEHKTYALKNRELAQKSEA